MVFIAVTTSWSRKTNMLYAPDSQRVFTLNQVSYSNNSATKISQISTSPDICL